MAQPSEKTGLSDKTAPHEHHGKKVEYIELIYDLIFVFLLQQNNSLLIPEADGFFGPNAFVTYILSTLIVLQVWVFSVLYINRYGENSILDHVFLFANMYLLYYMGVETRLDWWYDYQAYNTAWALIMINLAVQYLIKAKKVGARHPKAKKLTHTRAALYFVDAFMILLTIPIFRTTRVSLVWLALLIGFAGPFVTTKIEEAVPISFEHLSERVMLFVVFTFGEMIISITEYFTILAEHVGYYSLMAFLMVIGLFMSYGYLYNNVMDRNRHTNGRLYLGLHVIIVVALSNVSVCLEYERDAGINQTAMAIFLAASLIVYYITLFLVARVTGIRHVHGAIAPFAIPTLISSAALVALIYFFSHTAWIVIGVVAAYALAQDLMIVLRWRAVRRRQREAKKAAREQAA